MALLVALLLALFVLSAPWSYVAVGAGAAIELGEAWFWWWLSHRRSPAVGVETLIGRVATVSSACRPRGQVRVAGELWQGRCDAGADVGDEVRVVEVDGLELIVEQQ
ncbi:MAG: NfeD family protein [Actinobacteria bacterium]|nr:NfeD family protein [Actinomycetota bacterium]